MRARDDLMGFSSCNFNAAIECANKGDKCNKCGWNPEVAERRKKNNKRKKISAGV